MKKSLIALAAVAASGAAFAQSSVTLFGVVDANVTHVRGEDNWNGMGNSGNSSSRLGFRGVEDLGNGLKAQFWLEGAINNDDGLGYGAGKTSKNSDGGFSFQRRSTISLLGNFGEVRLGRSLTAAYDATSRYDVFGNVGVAQARLWEQNRQNNMVGYYSPNFSGFKVGVNYGFGESTDANGNVSNSASSYAGIGLTYDNGPLSLGLGYDRLNDGNRENSNGVVAFADERRTWTLGGSYNFGVAKLAAAYANDKFDNAAGATTKKQKSYYVGLSAPVGAAGEVKVSYNRYNVETAVIDGKADQFGLGYVHNLSKRTAVYGTYAYIKNKDGAAVKLSSDVALKDGEKQHAVQVGIRHAF